MQPGGADMRYCVCAAEVQSTHVTHQLLWHNSFLHNIKLSHTSHYLQVITLHDLLHQPPSCDMSILSHTSPPHQLQVITTHDSHTSTPTLGHNMVHTPPHQLQAITSHQHMAHTSPPHQLQAITSHRHMAHTSPPHQLQAITSHQHMDHTSPQHQLQAITLHDLPALATFL